MFCAEWRAAQAIGAAAKTRSGKLVQDLHAAHRAADDAEQRVDAEMIDQQLLRPHHVADRDDGKGQAPGLAGRRVDVLRTAGPHAAAEHVGADDEITLGIEHLAGAGERRPPAGIAGDRMRLGEILVAGQRMADEDGVAARRIEPAIGLVGDGELREIDAAIELEGLRDVEAMAGARRGAEWRAGCRGFGRTSGLLNGHSGLSWGLAWQRLSSGAMRTAHS